MIEQLIGDLDEALEDQELHEISRRAGNVLRHAVTLGDPRTYALRGLAKLIVRSYHNLEGDVARYKQKKKAIRQDKTKTREQKRREIDALERQTLHLLSSKVRQERNKKRLAKGRATKNITKRDIRTAKRAVYGTPFGTRVY